MKYCYYFIQTSEPALLTKDDHEMQLQLQLRLGNGLAQIYSIYLINTILFLCAV